MGFAYIFEQMSIVKGRGGGFRNSPTTAKEMYLVLNKLVG
jgi:hypothetical protein